MARQLNGWKRSVTSSIEVGEPTFRRNRREVSHLSPEGDPVDHGRQLASARTPD